MGTAYNKTDSLHDLPTPFVYCRTFGHSWEEFVPTMELVKRKRYGFLFTLLCTHCGTERHDSLTSKGLLITRKYQYPDGYQVAFAADRADYRKELNQRKRKIARRQHLEVVI